jgi:hypothetical protein
MADADRNEWRDKFWELVDVVGAQATHRDAAIERARLLTDSARKVEQAAELSLTVMSPHYFYAAKRDGLRAALAAAHATREKITAAGSGDTTHRETAGAASSDSAALTSPQPAAALSQPTPQPDYFRSGSPVYGGREAQQPDELDAAAEQAIERAIEDRVVADAVEHGRDPKYARLVERAWLKWQKAQIAEGEAPDCEWRDEDDDGFPVGPFCGKPAEYVSCKPFKGSLTCEGHKCRCATPIAKAQPNAGAGAASWCSNCGSAYYGERHVCTSPLAAEGAGEAELDELRRDFDRQHVRSLDAFARLEAMAARAEAAEAKLKAWEPVMRAALEPCPVSEAKSWAQKILVECTKLSWEQRPGSGVEDVR